MDTTDDEVASEKRFRLSISGEHEIAYLRLPGYPAEGNCKMSKSMRLIDLKPDYKGPDVVLDFGPSGVLIGIEVLAD